MTVVLFNDALQKASDIAKKFKEYFEGRITFVRDLKGRIRVILESKPKDMEWLKGFEEQFISGLGAYSFSKRPILFWDELSINESIINERRLIEKFENLKIYLLDRQIVGQDWMLNKIPRSTGNPRVTFYGIKGGVGRSTTLVNWAWHLADQGKKVLIFDLDLESPGISNSMLPISYLPDYGIVDWFVEDGIGQSDISDLEICVNSPLAEGTQGEIYVIPAYGSKTGDYIPKLSRCYSEAGVHSEISWAERLQKLVESQEKKYHPDIVIFDSRAGLHDIAAVLATRMDATTLLFAIDTPQTWAGYELLFKHWRDHSELSNFRLDLQIVAGMIPETNRDNYIQSFKEHAWDLFRNIYDEVDEQNNLEAFNFNLDDASAPHYPIPIFWHRALQEFNPNNGGINKETAIEAFRHFFSGADQLLGSILENRGGKHE